jgi:hypothetical protein
MFGKRSVRRAGISQCATGHQPDHLPEKNFEPFRFERLGSAVNFSKGSDGHIVDVYKLMDR